MGRRSFIYIPRIATVAPEPFMPTTAMVYCGTRYGTLDQQAISSTGTSWVIVDSTPSWTNGSDHYVNMTSIDGTLLYLMNFGAYPGSVWNSTDIGASWTRIYDGEGVNYNSQRITTFKGEVIIIGGLYKWSDTDLGYARNSVWKSTDSGDTFTEFLTHTPDESSTRFHGRWRFGILEYDDKCWVMGGSQHNDRTELTNDVWCSDDLSVWTMVSATGATGWSSRFDFGYCVFDNKMWVMGGSEISEVSGLLNDVWWSTDGIDWTEATSNASWSPRHGYITTVFDDKMWVIGGHDAGNFTNDSWYSTDGITWTQGENLNGTTAYGAVSSI